MTAQPKPQGGSTANGLGAHEEERITKWLQGAGYQCVIGQEHLAVVRALNVGAPVSVLLLRPGSFYRQLPAFKSIFGVPFKADFIIVPFSNGPLVVLELKSQTSAGSVDEKLPFWMFTLDAVSQQGATTILAILGEGARKGALAWCAANSQKTQVFTSAQALKARLVAIQ